MIKNYYGLILQNKDVNILIDKVCFIQKLKPIFFSIYGLRKSLYRTPD